MSSFRRILSSGVQRLAERLGELGDMLATIKDRLHDAVADALSRSVSAVAREAVLYVVEHLSDVVPIGRVPMSGGQRWRNAADDVRRLDDGYHDHRQEWHEDEDDEHDFDRPITGTASKRITPLFVGVSAMLQAASWLLPRCPGKRGFVTAGVLSILAGCAAFISPTFAIAGLGLAHSASRHGLMSDLLRSLGLS